MGNSVSFYVIVSNNSNKKNKDKYTYKTTSNLRG